MLINLKPHGILITYSFQHCSDTGMQNGDDALSSIILSGRGILVKMLITLNGMLKMYFHQFFHTYPLHWYNIIILNIEK